MRRNAFLLVLTVIGSALLWWPVTIEPNLDLPFWLPLLFIALLTGLAAALSGGRWPLFVVASTVGTFAGVCGGFAIWTSSDPIAGSYAPSGVARATRGRHGGAGYGSRIAHRGSSRAESFAVERKPATCRMACVVILRRIRAGSSRGDSTSRRVSDSA